MTVHDGIDTRSGLGDLYAQVLVIPKFNKSYTFAWGTGMVFPTATNSVGSDKWQLAPAVAPILFFGRLKGFALIKFQNFVSVAGEDDRPDINYFLVTPTSLRRISRSWWIVVDSESKIDWERDNRTSFKSGLQVGKMMSPRVGQAGNSLGSKPLGRLDREGHRYPDPLLNLVPVLDGLALCRQIKADPRTRGIAVLVFSIWLPKGGSVKAIGQR